MSDTHNSGPVDAPSRQPIPRLSEDAEDLLAYRVLKKTIGYVLGVVGAIGAVLAFFGYDVVRDFNRARTEVVALTQDLKEEVDSTRALNERLIAQLTQEKSQLTMEVQLLASTAETYQRAYTEQIVQTAEQIATASARANQSTEQSQRSIAQVAAEMRELAAERARVDQSLRQADSARAAFHTVANTYNVVIDTIRQKVFGSWTVMAKEKSSTPIQGTGHVITISTIRDEHLRDFQITDSTGRVVAPARHLPIGQPVQFVADGYRYTFTPRYAIEHWPGKDLAGIQVDQQRVAAAVVQR